MYVPCTAREEVQHVEMLNFWIRSCAVPTETSSPNLESILWKKDRGLKYETTNREKTNLAHMVSLS